MQDDNIHIHSYTLFYFVSFQAHILIALLRIIMALEVRV